MESGTARLGFAAAALIGLWVLVYWWTPGPVDSVEVAYAPPMEGPELVFEQPPVAEPRPSAETVVSTPTPAPASADPTPQVVPPSFYRYTVRSGDTAQGISRRFYGVADHWHSVMRANPKTDFQKLRVGQEILVPVNPRNVQGLRVPKEKADATAEPSTTPAASAAGFDYKVEPGDTLSGLAQRFYGRASAWRAIVEVNLGALGSEGERLRPGMTIIIPPAPEPAKKRR